MCRMRYERVARRRGGAQAHTLPLRTKQPFRRCSWDVGLWRRDWPFGADLVSVPEDLPQVSRRFPDGDQP